MKFNDDSFICFVVVGNMYVYEGRDYSRETTEADKTAFDKCLKGEIDPPDTVFKEK